MHLDQLNNITDASTIPLIGDGDTGYGNAMNVIRTVKSFAKLSLNLFISPCKIDCWTSIKLVYVKLKYFTSSTG